MVQDLFSRPIWCQFWPELAGSGFRSQLVHFFPGPGPGPGYFLCIIIRYSLCIIIRYSLCRIIRYSLCGTDTVSVWDTHSVSVWDTHSPGWRAGGGSRTTPTPHWGFPVPPHTHPKLLSRSCGGMIDLVDHVDALWARLGARGGNIQCTPIQR